MESVFTRCVLIKRFFGELVFTKTAYIFYSFKSVFDKWLCRQTVFYILLIIRIVIHENIICYIDDPQSHLASK